MTTPQATPERLDIYSGIHKALRAFMTDTLTRVTRVDLQDGEDVAATLAQTRELMAFCTGHLEHENDFVHTAMEGRCPGASGDIAEEHCHHLASIAALQGLVDSVERAAGPARERALAELQRQLARFIGENFIHMHQEETQNNAVLWAAYSDAELAALHQSIVASLAPEETAAVMRWMIPAITPAERAALLSDLRDHAPKPVFEGVMAIANAQLPARDWHKLVHALENTLRLAA